MLTETRTETTLPAIAGGERIKKTPFTVEPKYGGAEMEELADAISQQTLFCVQGRKVKALEAKFAEMTGARFAVACSNGTAAVHAALIAAGISPGDEVITTPISDMGTVIPILLQGAVPVFADLDPRTYCLDPASVRSKVTPRTRAVLAVHLWGNACDLAALAPLCERHGLILIEDCAQAIGSRYSGASVGTFGLCGAFSLNEFKHLSCGDGGMIVTNDEAVGTRLRLAVDKCYDRTPGAVVRKPFFLTPNYRMTELQGAVALAQFQKLDRLLIRRRAWCSRLSQALSEIPGILPPLPSADCDPSWLFYPFRVEPDVLGASADQFAAALGADGIGAGAHYIGQCLYEYPLFADHSAYEHGPHPFASAAYAKGDCPTAEAILETLVSLSVNEGFTDGDLEETVCAFRRNAAWFRSKRPAAPQD